MEESNLNAIDKWGAICQMKGTKGWQLLMDRYAKEGDEILTKILDLNTPENLRALYIHQMNALSRLSKVLVEFEEEAKLEQVRQKEPAHIGK